MASQIVGVDLAKGADQHAEALVKGGRLVAEIPPGAGRVVAMVNHQGKILVACEYGVYVLKGDRLEPVEWAWSE